MQENMKNKKSKIKLLFKLTICFISLFGLFLCTQEKIRKETYAATINEKQVVYLSDIPYVPELGVDKSYVGWRSIAMDQNLETNYNGGLIALKVNGEKKKFLKGISAHANSQVIFDVSKYVEQGFTKFSTYYGVDASRGSTGNAVYFKIVSKTDEDATWVAELNRSPNNMKGDSEAGFIEIDLTGKKYIKLEAYGIGGISAAHACYADAKLTKPDYNEEDTKADFIKPVEEYDKILKEKYNTNKLNITDDYELTLLQRYFVNAIEYDVLQGYVALNQDNYDTVKWLMTDVENLRYYILGGQPTGGYLSSLKVLTRLYTAHKDDFNDKTEISNQGKELIDKKQLNWPKTKGNLYKRMAITISLTHSSVIGLWMQSGPEVNKSDAVVRYEQYKYMYNEGKFKATDNVDITPWFETYTIEEMRYVMHVMLDDEEMIWLNEYTQSKIDADPNRVWSYLTPHPYMAYVAPNYNNDIYYSEENKDYFNDLFKVGDKKLWDYNITRGTTDNKIQKLWMNFRNKFNTGAVCGGISKTGHCIRGANAIPSAVIGQPGHAAIIYYTRNSDGQGYWGIDNNINGWAQSEKRERLPIGWGSDWWYRSTYNIPYIILSQEALNDYNNFVKAEEILILADVYQDDTVKQEEIYREAIKVQSINLDAWVRLIKLYLADDTKTEEQYYNLAQEMMEDYKCFPYTMYDLANKIKGKFTSSEYQFKYQILETRILTEGKDYPNENSQVLQPSATRVLASYLLGKVDTNLASFSFDGDDAGKIVLSDRFNENGIRWDYSIDGKNTWNEVSFSGEEEHKLQLTKEQISSITAENDIYVHIVGVNYNEENLYKIDILESAGVPETVYANDLENRIIGVNLSTEWRYKDTDPWTSYATASPDLTGDKSVQLRQGATGTRLASEASEVYTFTKDNQPDTRKYIPVSHLSKVAVSTEATNHGGAATNALDANYNTRWHSAWNGTDTQRYITVKLDKPVYLSAIEFVPAGGGNGKIVDGTIFGSTDGENWEVLTSRTGITYPKQANTIEDAKALTQNFEIDEPKEVQYVKIVADKTNGNWFTARAFNFYQDLTKVDTHPTAGIAYSTTEKTYKPVIARIVNPSTKITITNNNGKDSYVFTENGEFTFEFKDERGNTGTALAKVNWIDSKAPTADVSYKLSDDKKLIAVLDNISEDVYLLDPNNRKTNYIEVENGKVKDIQYLDENEKAYKIVELDENKVTAKISYTNTTGEVSNVALYTIIPNGVDENGNETFEEEFYDNEGNRITNLSEEDKTKLQALQDTARSNPLEHYMENNEEYEFKLLDKANNVAYKNIKADYIDDNTKILASDITYSTVMPTNKDVIATIKPYLIDMEGKNYNVEIINNSKKAQYTFKKNGEFTFQYAEVKKLEEGEEREIKTHTAKVNWIKDNIEKPEQPEIPETPNTPTDPGKDDQDKELTFKTIYKTMKKDNSQYIYMINAKTMLSEFSKNCETNGIMNVYESNDNILENSKYIGTGMILKNKKGDKEVSYKLSVIGDTDGNGEVTPTDLADAIRKSLGENNLNELQTLSVDIDENGEITPTDLAEMIKMTLGK